MPRCNALFDFVELSIGDDRTLSVTRHHLNVLKRPCLISPSPKGSPMKMCVQRTSELAELLCIMRALHAKDFAYTTLLAAGFRNLQRKCCEIAIPAKAAWFMTTDADVNPAAKMIGDTIVKTQERSYHVVVKPATTRAGSQHPFVFEVVCNDQLVGVAMGVEADIEFVPAIELREGCEALDHLTTQTRPWSTVDRERMLKHAVAIDSLGRNLVSICPEEAESIVHDAVRACFPLVLTAVRQTTTLAHAPHELQALISRVFSSLAPGADADTSFSIVTPDRQAVRNACWLCSRFLDDSDSVLGCGCAMKLRAHVTGMSGVTNGARVDLLASPPRELVAKLAVLEGSGKIWLRKLRDEVELVDHHIEPEELDFVSGSDTDSDTD
jgi:hypothetical protein